MKLLRPLTLPLLAGALCLTACGDKSDAPEESSAAKEIKIPEAPDAAIQYIVRELADGNGTVLWEAMPASYQSDVNSIAQLAGTKIDAEIYDRIFTTVARIGTILDNQKEFVFNTSVGGNVPDPEKVSQMREAWPSVTNIIKVLTSSSLSSAAGLQSFEGEAFFNDTVSVLIADMEALSKLQPENEEAKLSDLEDMVVKYIGGNETEATLEMSSPNAEAETATFVKVDDRWVPQEIAQQWATQIAESRAKLEAIDPKKMEEQKPQILSVFAMIDGVLTQIESAKTQEQFDQALQGAMMPMMGLMMMGQGMGGAGSAPAMPPMPAAPAAP